MKQGWRLGGLPALPAALCLAMGAGFAALVHATDVGPRGDRSQQSAALFTQMAPVFQHPRCMNCHTGEDFPRQGDDAHRHVMNVARGPEGNGAPGLHCSTCHQSMNQSASGVPGAPGWQLAPTRMMWKGLTVGQLCRALFDPVRGAMKPAQFVPHFDTALVRWAWTPGTDAHGRTRSLPPVSHEQFVALTQQWIATGATCPEP
jgi:hypothetical protein